MTSAPRSAPSLSSNKPLHLNPLSLSRDAEKVTGNPRRKSQIIVSATEKGVGPTAGFRCLVGSFWPSFAITSGPMTHATTNKITNNKKVKKKYFYSFN